MPYRQKGSKFWYIRVPGPLGRTRRSSGTTDYKEAAALEARLQVEDYNARVWGREPTRFFSTLMVDFLKACADEDRFERYDHATKALRRHFDGRALNGDGAISRQHINEYKAARAKEGAAPATVRKELLVLSAAINHAVREWGWNIDNPVKGRLPKKAPSRVRWITPKEAGKLIDAAARQKRAKYLAGFITLALNTGMRRGELTGLTWDRVDFVHRKIYLEPEHQKSRRRDAIPLNDAAVAALKAQLGCNKKYVFTNRGHPLQSVRKAFDAACKTAGIENFHVHDLRHTFAAWMVQAGVDIRQVADIMRHKDITTTMIYAHLAPESGRAAVERMEIYIDNRRALESEQRALQAKG
jgi:integrase